MGVMERLTGRSNGNEQASLRETALRQRWELERMTESLRELEDQMVDGEWRRIGMQLDREFTRAGLDDLMDLSRAMYLSHPLILRAVNVRTYYTWGQGVEINAHENIMDNVVTPMLEDDSNQQEYFSHQARLLTDVDQEVDGNVFQALFVGDPVKVRSIPADQMRVIHTNPEDRGEVWFYERRWNQDELDVQSGRVNVNVAKHAYYPDVSYWHATRDEGRRAERIDSINGVPVMWQSPVLHQRTGGLKQMKFGVPSTYAALDWARAYKKFLEDWHTIVSSLARFTWRATTKNSKAGKVRDKLAWDEADEAAERPTGYGRQSGQAGNAWVGNADVDLTPINKTGTTTSADDAKASRLMVASAMDIPDTILSNDPQQGALATAKSLDRPTELGFISRQNMWSHHDQRLFAFAVAVAEDENRLGNVPDDERKITVSFPDILEHDTVEQIKALVSAVTLDGKSEAGTMPRELVSRLLMQALGVDDIEQALKDLGEEEQDELRQAVSRLEQALSTQAQPPAPEEAPADADQEPVA